MHFPHLLYEVSSSGGPWAGDVRKRMGGRRGCRFRISLFRIVVLPWRAVQAAERAGFGPSVCILRSLSSSAAWSIQQSGNQARMKQASGWEAGAAAIVAHRFFVSLNRGGAGWLLSECVHSSVAFLVCCMKYPAVGEPGENKACKRMGSRRAISLIAFSFHTVAELAWVRLRAYFRRFPRLLYEVSSSRGTASFVSARKLMGGVAAIFASRLFLSYRGVRRSSARWLWSKCGQSFGSFPVCCMKYPAVGEPGHGCASKRMRGLTVIFAQHLARFFRIMLWRSWLALVHVRAIFLRFLRLLYEVSSSRGTALVVAIMRAEAGSAAILRFAFSYRTVACGAAELAGCGPSACNFFRRSSFLLRGAFSSWGAVARSCKWRSEPWSCFGPTADSPCIALLVCCMVHPVAENRADRGVRKWMEVWLSFSRTNHDGHLRFCVWRRRPW